MRCPCLLKLLRRVSRFDAVGTSSGDVGTLLYRVTDDAKQARKLSKLSILYSPYIGVITENKLETTKNGESHGNLN